MFKKHSIQLTLVKNPDTKTETEEQKPFMTEDEIAFAKYVVKNAALFAFGYMATKIALNTVSKIIINHM